MNVGLLLKGAAMGIAEAIPGVSGGTIAFITGIYEELLQTIKSFTLANLKLLLSDRARFWEAINGKFLLFLLGGMVMGLGFGIAVISHALEHYKMILWAFFFGLVLASAIYLGKGITWDGKKIVGFVVGVVAAYFLTRLTPVDGSDNPLYLFFAGMIAISALMLPGLSGSFMLLIFGLYDRIVNGLKSLVTEQDLSQLVPIGIFSAGALVGLFSFARILSYTFQRFPQTTMATMIGFLIGSLPKLWPWKEITSVYSKETGATFSGSDIPYPLDLESFKILTEQNLLPSAYAHVGDVQLIPIMIAVAVGAALVGGLANVSAKG